MTTRYRLLETVDWEALNGQRITLEVSPNDLIAVTKDGALIQLAKAMRPGHKKGDVNGAGGGEGASDATRDATATAE